MSPERLQQVLTLAGAGEPDDAGFREFPTKVTLSLYLAKNGVGLTVPSVEAIAVHGDVVQARTTKGEVYFTALEDLFAANVDGKVEPKSTRRAGFI